MATYHRPPTPDLGPSTQRAQTPHQPPQRYWVFGFGRREEKGMKMPLSKDEMTGWGIHSRSGLHDWVVRLLSDLFVWGGGGFFFFCLEKLGKRSELWIFFSKRGEIRAAHTHYSCFISIPLFIGLVTFFSC